MNQQNKMYLLGYDIGSSSVKASLIDVESGNCAASAFAPKSEAPIMAVRKGWAEQEPESWWSYLKEATQTCLAASAIKGNRIAAIGISYQMHGLVCCDKEQRVLRPAIIWCDSRAVTYGDAAAQALGNDFCIKHLLNLPGNFTAAKLAWVKENEPQVFEKTDKFMLPGDYIAMRLTGEAHTTLSGLSEGMFWDFNREEVSRELMDYFGFSQDLIPALCPTFGEQGTLLAPIARELGLPAGIPVTYRAGDQPNNALSLGVLNPGEIASTAGTSGVVYGVSDQEATDRQSRVNIFAHVNHTHEQRRLGALLCINGTGILNSWVKHNLMPDVSYDEMNRLAESAPIGAAGLSIIPFGNGAERILQNGEPGAALSGINFNIHRREHIARAVQEGIVFSFKYGMEIMESMGTQFSTIHAGKANMFLSPLFRRTLATLANATIELYNTDGAAGAARGAGVGAAIYKSFDEAFARIERCGVTEPDRTHRDEYIAAYEKWKSYLQKYINQ